ncbi:MAG: hypothetical protein LBQ93_10785 [Treponema sp.]|jgi:hypothetical protein|nr:hypothetical protein [Treponema sp.]
MKKRTVFGATLLVLLILQTQMVFASDDDSYAFYIQLCNIKNKKIKNWLTNIK